MQHLIPVVYLHLSDGKPGNGCRPSLAEKLSHAKQPDASVTFISCTTTVSAPCKLSQEILQSSYMANRHITAYL